MFGIPEDDIFISAKGINSRVIEYYDQLSVTVKWKVTQSNQKDYSLNPSNSLTAYLVYGSPYITVKYNSLVPVIGTAHRITSVNGDTNEGSFFENKYKISLTNGQTYLIYSLNNPLPIVWSNNKLICTTPLNGVIRIAILPTPEHEVVLNKQFSTYPIAANIKYSIFSNTADIEFNFITEGGDQNNLLMLAFPHHIDSLVNFKSLNYPYRVLKGFMIPIIGHKWVMREKLTTIEWNSPGKIDPSKLDVIKQSLLNDLKEYPQIPSDTYSFGKVVARYARLALIADEVGNDSACFEFIQRMKDMLNPWLTMTHPINNLYYDSTWGGLVSQNGINDKNAEYGHGYYNDHHYHWGYFVYAAAVIAKFDKIWMKNHERAIHDIIRDYGNTSSQDKYFPIARHKDFFSGHSWASGLFEFADAKNQESSSEAVNGYYAIYLWGLATNDDNIKDWGRILLATEIRTAKKYWHMDPNDISIYEEPFNKQLCVGIMWGTKVDYATWFGLNVEYIHGIQFLPFTPITEELLSREWIKKEYEILESSLKRKEPPIQEEWKGFVYLAKAIIDKEKSWNLILNLKSFDNGNSKTNSLYFVATRIQ